MPANLLVFFKFCSAGALGFIVDATACAGLMSLLDLSPYTARFVSVLLAMTATWLVNRSMTFQQTHAPHFGEWIRYVSFNSLGAILNYAAYALTIATVPGAPVILGIAIGSLVGLLINFGFNANFVFAPKRD